MTSPYPIPKAALMYHCLSYPLLVQAGLYSRISGDNAAKFSFKTKLIQPFLPDEQNHELKKNKRDQNPACPIFFLLKT